MSGPDDIEGGTARLSFSPEVYVNLDGDTRELMSRASTYAAALTRIQDIISRAESQYRSIAADFAWKDTREDIDEEEFDEDIAEAAKALEAFEHRLELELAAWAEYSEWPMESKEDEVMLLYRRVS